MSNAKMILQNFACWIDYSLKIIGLVTVFCFVKVNFFSGSLTLQIPNTPVFASVVIDPELEEFFLATKKPVASKGKTEDNDR